MDFSGYDKNHKCYDATDKKVLGKFQDEVDGRTMTGFIGLRSKCYAFKIHGDDTEYRKCKDTAKNTVKRQITYDDYNQVLETNKIIHRPFNSIRSKNQKIYSINTTKVSLNSYENIRYWTTSVDSLAYGHFKINDFKNDQGINLHSIVIEVCVDEVCKNILSCSSKYLEDFFQIQNGNGTGEEKNNEKKKENEKDVKKTNNNQCK